MTGRERCDEIMRLIDQVLADEQSPGSGAALDGGGARDSRVDWPVSGQTGRRPSRAA